MTTIHPIRRQAGSFLLEALIGILVFAVGVLGIVGLQAHSLRVTNESQYRAEAAYLANMLVSEMWADDYRGLKAKYDSGGGGAAYAAWKTKVKMQLGAVWVADPEVEFDDTRTPSLQSSYVRIKVKFMMPGEPTPHWHETSGVIGHNL
jgi:type IV pilus assembly protein PilV